MKLFCVLACVLALYSAGASAEVKQASADSFLITFEAPVAATPAKTYAAIGLVQHWWSDEQTWSGKAANLSLTPTAGACFCERWKDGSVERGRVIMALPNRLLRLDAALGPLQEFALKGILNFWIRTGDDGATTLSVDYRVNGASNSGLDTLAPQVDQTLGAEVARLVRFIDTGNPEAPAAAPAPPKSPDVQASLLEQWAQQAMQEQGKKAAGPKSHPAKPEKKP